MGQLATSRAGGEFDLSKTIESIIQGNKQFGADLGFREKSLTENRRQFNEGQTLNREGINIAERIGREQANASRPGSLDWLNTALKGLSTGAQIYGAYKGVR